MKGDMDMKEKNRAEEWFRAKHDELAETARANLAAHDLEPGQEAYHLDSLHYATAEQMEAICPTGIDFDMSRYVDRGMFKPLKDPQTFDRVRLAFGVPSWPGDIDIAAERVRSDMQII